MREQKNKSTYIVIAAYNESKKIGSVIKDLQVNGYHNIIVIDDGSKDDTQAIAKKFGAVVLSHKINLGQGAALQTGFEYCKKIEADIVVTYDADGQFSAKEVKNIVAPLALNKADVTFGSRFLGKTIAISSSRKFLLKLGIIFTWFFSGVKLTDTHNGFRGLNKKALSLISINENGMAHASEIIDQTVSNNLRYIEIPVTVTYSEYSIKKGQNSMNSLKIISSLFINRFN